jgi:hypothetical protein
MIASTSFWKRCKKKSRVAKSPSTADHEIRIGSIIDGPREPDF